MINTSNQYCRRGKQESDMRASREGGKRKSWKGREDTTQRREREDTEGRTETQWAGGPSPKGCVGSNKPEHTEESSPAPGHISGKSDQSDPKERSPGNSYERKVLFMLWGLWIIEDWKKEMGFLPRKTCTERNFAPSAREFTKPLDLHKKQTLTVLCPDDGVSAAGTASHPSAPLCNVSLPETGLGRRQSHQSCASFLSSLSCPIRTQPSPPSLRPTPVQLSRSPCSQCPLIHSWPSSCSSKRWCPLCTQTSPKSLRPAHRWTEGWWPNHQWEKHLQLK